MRELAAQIDLRRREPLEEESISTPDQIMVCLSSKGPNSEMLLRYGSRLAGKLNRNWYAVYVQTSSEEPTIIDAQTQRVLSGTLTLAKQLGAIVFTYKGDNIADTILRFAREYRVGHIVIGTSSPPSLWSRLLGKKSIVEQLIQNAHGITIVVPDTQTDRRESAGAPVAAESSLDSTGQQTQAARQPALSDYMSAGRVVIWQEPAFKEEVIRTLVDTMGRDCKELDHSIIYDAVWQREKESSTFFNEGVAFPHARIDGLTAPLVALGLTRQGVVDVSTDKPIACVFLIIAPRKQPHEQVQVLSLASKAMQNRYLTQALNSASDAQEIVSIHKRLGTVPITQTHFSGCSKTSRCKAREILRNEAYFSVRCNDDG